MATEMAKLAMKYGIPLDEYDERAGQLEYDANMRRTEAELRAFNELKAKYKKQKEAEIFENTIAPERLSEGD